MRAQRLAEELYHVIAARIYAYVAVKIHPLTLSVLCDEVLLFSLAGYARINILLTLVAQPRSVRFISYDRGERKSDIASFSRTIICFLTIKGVFQTALNSTCTILN